MNKTQNILKGSKLIVIKIGSMLVRGDGLDDVNQEWMNTLAQDILALKNQGKKIVIVSSGGIALGRKALGIPTDISPSTIPLAKKQAASAVGQYHLFNGYFNALKKQNITAAQILLTMSETENRRMSLNARETLHTLLENNIVPVINENDTVSTGEIRFGDNDRLSVRVAQMIMADCVVLLSTANGLYTDNPDTNPQAELIPVIDNITDEHIKMAGDAVAGLSTGGMKSKIDAAILASKSGVNLIITDGCKNHSLSEICNDDNKKSSIFIAKKCKKSAREIWLGSHLNPKGTVIIDNGAYDALKKGKSLLPIGIKTVEGNFRRGDVIEIMTLAGNKIAVGLSAYNSFDTNRIAGKHGSEIVGILGYTGRTELIHRNDMVLEV